MAWQGRSVTLTEDNTIQKQSNIASLSLKAGELKTFLRTDEILEWPRQQNTSKMFSVVPTTRNSSTTQRSHRTTREKWTVTWFWSCAVAPPPPTRPVFGYGWDAEGLRPWPCLSQKSPKIHTLFRKTSSILVPCLGQLPQFYCQNRFAPILHTV